MSQRQLVVTSFDQYHHHHHKYVICREAKTNEGQNFRIDFIKIMPRFRQIVTILVHIVLLYEPKCFVHAQAQRLSFSLKKAT